MATDIVSSLFGVRPSQVEDELLKDDIDMGGLFAAATMNTYAPANVQNAYLKKQQAQFALGSLGARKLGGLFGIEDPELQRVSKIQSTLKGVQDSLSPEDLGNPEVFYPALVKSLNAAGLSSEASLVALQGNKEIADYQGKKEDREIRKLNKEALVAQNQVAIEKQRTERAGQIAYGATTAMNQIKDPALASKVWEKALSELEKVGVDTSSAKDLPWEQRGVFLESVMNSSMTAGDRSKEEIAALKASQKEQELLLRKEIADMRDKQKTLDRESRESIAMQGLIAAMERTLATIQGQQQRDDSRGDDLDKRLAWNTQGQSLSTVGSKESRRNARRHASEVLEIDSDSLNSVEEDYVAIKQKYLKEKDEKGFPKYNPEEAESLAWQDVEKNTQDIKAIVGTKKVYNRKKATSTPSATKSPETKTTTGYTAIQEDWISRAMKANNISREQAIAEGKKLGKF